MQLSVFCFLVFSAMGFAKPNPQIYGKRYLSQPQVFYLVPQEIKSLQAVQSSPNPRSAIDILQQNEQINRANEGLQKYNGQQSQPLLAEKSQVKNVRAQDVYLKQEKDVNENLQNNNIAYIYLVKEEEQGRLDNQQEQNVRQVTEKVESQIETNSNASPYVPVSYKNQKEKFLHEQLTQHWNRLLEHNRAQLLSLSSAKNGQEQEQEQNGQETANQVEKESEQSQIQRDHAQKVIKTENQEERDENEKTEVEKEIESILRNHQALQSAKLNPRGSPPILIHRQVSITKHHPIPIYKQVNVQVPTPVLVPVPEPYAVRVPQPYPVPLGVVKHIPVPVIKN